MFSSALRKGLLTGRAVQSPFMASSMLASQQANLLGMAPSASFAKFTRNKPHLNVGTIGMSQVLSYPRANAPSTLLNLLVYRPY